MHAKNYGCYKGFLKVFDTELIMVAPNETVYIFL